MSSGNEPREPARNPSLPVSKSPDTVGSARPSPDSPTVLGPLPNHPLSAKKPPAHAEISSSKHSGNGSPEIIGASKNTIIMSPTISAKSAPPPKLPSAPKHHPLGLMPTLQLPKTDIKFGKSISFSAESVDIDLEEASWTPESGDWIGDKYELLAPLGRGGMGVVFQARDDRLGRLVAIKFNLVAYREEAKRRFIKEARITANLTHENIVRIHDVGEWNKRPYMVLEYIYGTTLKKYLAGKPLPESQVIDLMIPVVRGLAYAHEKNIIHRDIKAENIMIDANGNPRLVDFGIAGVGIVGSFAPKHALPEKPIQAADLDLSVSHFTNGGEMMGTLDHMPPECWNNKEIDARSDQFALGITMTRAATGRHPYHGISGMQYAIMADVSQPMPLLHSFAPQLSAKFAAILDRCINKNKEKRYQNDLDLLRDLESLKNSRIYIRHHSDDGQQDNPYPGLAAFTEAQANLFFGRDNEKRAILHRLRDTPVMLIAGQSGAGKSSLVQAGVIPELKQSGQVWKSYIMRPGLDPLAGLADIVEPLLGHSDQNAPSAANPQQLTKLAQRLRDEPGLAGKALRDAARKDGIKLLLVCDQFEELFTLARAEDRKAFMACLTCIADDPSSPNRLILTVRSDFLDRIDARFMSVWSKGLFILGAPDKEGLKDAIERPAHIAGYQLAPEIVEDMIEHLQSSDGALSMAQSALNHLYEKKRDPVRKAISAHSYHELGGVAGALAHHADSVINQLSPEQCGLVKIMVRSLVSPERTRAVVPLEDMYQLLKDRADREAVDSLIERLVQGRLLAVRRHAGAVSVELIHESLIQGWPLIKEWVEQSSEYAHFLAQLKTAADLWSKNNRDHDLLWRGELAEASQRFRQRYAKELASYQQEFLDAVCNQRAKTLRRKKTYLVSGITLLVFLAASSTVAVLVIQRARNEAVRQASAAIVAEKAAQTAENEAKKNLDDAQRKERERALAARRAEESAQRAATESERANRAAEELLSKNQALLDAMGKVKKNAKDARLAREQAVKVAKDLRVLLEQERERVRRLQENVGSSYIHEEGIEWNGGEYRNAK